MQIRSSDRGLGSWGAGAASSTRPTRFQVAVKRFTKARARRECGKIVTNFTHAARRAGKAACGRAARGPSSASGRRSLIQSDQIG